MRPGDALDCSDPSNVQKRRQPFVDPYQLFPNTWAHPNQRPNWGLPFEMPRDFSGSDSATSKVARNGAMRAEDI